MYYYSLNEKLKKEFGCKVYKLSLSAPVTCPNRDGRKGTGGCIFCLGGSGAFSERGSVYSQIENAKARVKDKCKSGKYIAYFQSFTNTYGDVTVLEPIFTEAIKHPDIALLSLATRPDCLEKDKLDMLARLNKIKPVWVELGLQTIHESTADYIRRGYPLTDYTDAVKSLHALGIEVITHVILGLPGEDTDMMLDTVDFVGRSGSDGIKLQLLHVLRGTDLAEDYEKGLFKTLTLSQYVEILKKCIQILPPYVAIHRLTGDGAKRELIAPLWSADKKRVMNTIRKEFERDNIIQGALFV